MKVQKVSSGVVSLTFFTALSMGLTACSQNPHVLGADPQVPADRRNGPAAAPATPDSPGTPGTVENNKKPGEKSGDGKSEAGKPVAHEGCVLAAQVVTLDARPLQTSEKKAEKSGETSIAVDLNFPTLDASQTILDVTNAKLVMYTLSADKAKAQMNSTGCLKADGTSSLKEACGKFSGTDTLIFNLLSYSDHLAITRALNADKTIQFSLPADLGTQNAQLQLEVLVEKCAPKAATH